MAGFSARFLRPSFFFFFFFFLLSVKAGRQRHFKRYGDPQLVGGVDHQHSYGYLQGQSYIYGTKATFSLWDPYVEFNEFSLAQLWLLSYDENNTLSTLEAGWQVFPAMYGDSKPRLFVYWTKDNYNSTGCYNLNCIGFVQTSQNYVPGTTVLSPVSTVNGSQYEIKLYVFKDSKTKDWFLYVNDEQVGYWPQGLSALTLNYATLLEWGGEIINIAQNGQHTATQMGSGKFAEAGHKQAAYIRNLQWVDVQNSLQNVEISNLITNAEDPTCYNVVENNDTNWGTYFFFGGPGRNPVCP